MTLRCTFWIWLLGGVDFEIVVKIMLVLIRGRSDHIHCLQVATRRINRKTIGSGTNAKTVRIILHELPSDVARGR